jgi:hypothetical protein
MVSSNATTVNDNNKKYGTCVRHKDSIDSIMSDNTRSTMNDEESQHQQLIDGKYTIQQCMDVAEKAVCKKTSTWELLDVDAEERIPKFLMSGTLHDILLLNVYLCFMLENIRRSIENP